MVAKVLPFLIIRGDPQRCDFNAENKPPFVFTCIDAKLSH